MHVVSESARDDMVDSADLTQAHLVDVEITYSATREKASLEMVHAPVLRSEGGRRVDSE